jgi:hypothetical protein
MPYHTRPFPFSLERANIALEKRLRVLGLPVSGAMGV